MGKVLFFCVTRLAQYTSGCRLKDQALGQIIVPPNVGKQSHPEVGTGDGQAP